MFDPYTHYSSTPSLDESDIFLQFHSIENILMFFHLTIMNDDDMDGYAERDETMTEHKKEMRNEKSLSLVSESFVAQIPSIHISRLQDWVIETLFMSNLLLISGIKSRKFHVEGVARARSPQPCLCPISYFQIKLITQQQQNNKTQHLLRW